MARTEIWSLESPASALSIAFLPNSSSSSSRNDNNNSKTSISVNSWFFEDPLSKINSLKLWIVPGSGEVTAG